MKRHRGSRKGFIDASSLEVIGVLAPGTDARQRARRSAASTQRAAPQRKYLLSRPDLLDRSKTLG
jgi:hypothetical protein